MCLSKKGGFIYREGKFLQFPQGFVVGWLIHYPQIAYFRYHYSDVIMGSMVSQITSLTIVYSTVYSDADQTKHQSSASLAFVRGIRRWPVNSPHKWPVTRKMFPFDDVIMIWNRASPIVVAPRSNPADSKGSFKIKYVLKLLDQRSSSHRTFLKRLCPGILWSKVKSVSTNWRISEVFGHRSQDTEM